MSTNMFKRTLALLAACGALPAAAGAQQTPVPVELAIASGVVIDSLDGGGPLVGADVTIEGMNGGGKTDSLGRYRIDSIPPGDHRVAVYHPVLDAAGLGLYTAPITFKPGVETTVSLATPSARLVIGQLCAKSPDADVALLGQIKDVDTDQPIGGATATIAWEHTEVVNGTSLRQATTTRTDQSEADGRFHLCVPSTQSAMLSARLGGASTGKLPLALAPHSVVLPVLRLARGDSATTIDTSGPAHGHAVVAGHISGPTGAGAAGLNVAILGTAVQTSTGPDGAYRLESLPTGTQVLTVQGTGYAPATRIVELSAKSPQTVDVKLALPVAALPTVEVTAPAITAAYQRLGFTQRQQGKEGQFLTSDQIAARKAKVVTQLIKNFDGLREVQLPRGIRVNPTNTGRMCTSYYVDGQHVIGRGDFGDDELLPSPDQLIAVEVYRSFEHPVSLPASIPQNGCLTIVLWTRANLVPQG
jgi:hypothetical protein